MALFTAFGLAALLLLSERGVTTEANPNCTEVPPVTSVTAWPVSSSAITVNWAYSAPECGSVDRFELNYSRDGGTQMMLTVSDVTKRSANITGLDNKQGTYTISMTAVYQSTTSTASGPVVVDFKAPPPPGGVSAIATSGSSITVTWTPPTLPDNRPPVTGYTVTAVPSSGSTPELLPATATSTVLSGLQRGTVYTIMVVARNIIGDSTAAPARAQTFARPSQPQNLTITVLSNSSLAAVWMEPADDGGDAAITYTITLQGGPGATTRTVSSLRTTFTGLEAPNTYTVTVAAENRAGTSPPAEETISFQAPPPPGAVTAIVTSGSSINVTWTPPTLPANRPPVTGYTVTAVPSSGSTPEQLPATATSTVLSGLQRGTVYTIKVVAHSVVGDSMPGNYTIDFVSPHAVSGPDSAALLPAVVALAVALLTALLLLVAAVLTAILFYTRIRKLSAMLKATQGLHSHYDEVNMGPYSENVIQNFHDTQFKECGRGVTSNDVAMEDNPAYISLDLLH